MEMVLSDKFGENWSQGTFVSFIESLRGACWSESFVNLEWPSLVKRDISRHSECLRSCSLEAELETGILVPAVYWENALRAKRVFLASAWSLREFCSMNCPIELFPLEGRRPEFHTPVVFSHCLWTVSQSGGRHSFLNKSGFPQLGGFSKEGNIYNLLATNSQHLEGWVICLVKGITVKHQ